ncbi:hypothetical protein QZH41_003852 [Actinostola sp. cb2023]|nr:hypothetical protein QZH41_003852 [Actinostola sp. cb2023]
MNQAKRGKNRGGTGGGFNRGRRPVPSHPYNQNDEPKSHTVDVYPNRLLIHAITKLLGCQVTVEMYNGTIFDGILKTMSSKGDVILEMAHKVAKRNGHHKIEDIIHVPPRNDVIDTLVLGVKHIVYVSAPNVDLDEVKKDNFTDQAISNRLNGQLGSERQLQKWEDPSVEPDESMILDDTNMKNGLDPNEMFAANEKFGVKSTYDHEMLSYTTPVEGSKELESRAERLAREIEQESSHRDRAEADSGKTEEELFSSVVRNAPSQERSQRPKAKSQHAPSAREESKREVLADSLRSSSPKPQRVQQREREAKVADGVTKPAVAVEPVKATKEVPAATTTENTVSQVPVKTVKVQPHVVDEAQSGISIVDIKRDTSASADNQNKAQVKPVVKDKNILSKEVNELKQFGENFKLRSQDEELKKESSETAVVTDQGIPASELEQQKDSPEPTEQKPTNSPPKTEDKPAFKWNLDAKEFKPSQPVQPQQLHTTWLVKVMMDDDDVDDDDDSDGQRFYRADAVDTHSGSPISAAAAAGSPIIAQGPFAQFIAVQSSQQFPPGMVHQLPHQGYNMVHGPQGGQQHYMSPQTVGLPTSQGVAQGYQDSGMPLYAANNIQMAPAPSYPGSPQPSPTTTGQFHLQYIPQMIPQQQGSQPHLPQAVMAHSPGQPPQPVFMVQQPQQGGQQPVGMHGIPVSGPGTPMMNQFVPECRRSVRWLWSLPSAPLKPNNASAIFGGHSPYGLQATEPSIFRPKNPTPNKPPKARKKVGRSHSDVGVSKTSEKRKSKEPIARRKFSESPRNNENGVKNCRPVSPRSDKADPEKGSRSDSLDGSESNGDRYPLFISVKKPPEVRPRKTSDEKLTSAENQPNVPAVPRRTSESSPGTPGTSKSKDNQKPWTVKYNASPLDSLRREKSDFIVRPRKSHSPSDTGSPNAVLKREKSDVTLKRSQSPSSRPRATTSAGPLRREKSDIALKRSQPPLSFTREKSDLIRPRGSTSPGPLRREKSDITAKRSHSPSGVTNLVKPRSSAPPGPIRREKSDITAKRAQSPSSVVREKGDLVKPRGSASPGTSRREKSDVVKPRDSPSPSSQRQEKGDISPKSSPSKRSVAKVKSDLVKPRGSASTPRQENSSISPEPLQSACSVVRDKDERIKSRISACQQSPKHEKRDISPKPSCSASIEASDLVQSQGAKSLNLRAKKILTFPKVLQRLLEEVTKLSSLNLLKR